MNNGLPRRKRITSQREPGIKASDILSFSSAVLAVLASAIFYFAGWVYISHWYSFFGIDATELNLSAQTIVIHGVPGVLFIILIGFFAASSYAILKISRNEGGLGLDALPRIIVLAYVISGIGLFILLLVIYRFEFTFLAFPIEVNISLIGLYALFLLLSGFEQVVNIASGERFGLGINLFIVYVPLKPARLVAWAKILRKAIAKKDIDRILETFLLHKNVSTEIDHMEEQMLNEIRNQQSSIRNAALKAWQFWVGAFLILYFLVSVSVSSILGEWDARVGKKTMIGGWQGEATYIYSKRSDLPLPLDMLKTAAEKSNVYGPLLVLGKSEDTFYLTDWVYNFPISEKPNVYVIKLNEENSLGMQIIAPTSTPTITPHVLQTVSLTPDVIASTPSTP